MTSLDDSIISKQNMMLLDNVTNYSKSAIDYFHCDINNSNTPLSWSLLCKMKKHKLLRLPSCSIEDDIDYNMYLQRLHHCLWRRWSIEKFNLNNTKLDPLDINWNKNTDVTVLYGPDLSLPQSQPPNIVLTDSISIPNCKDTDTDTDTDSIHSQSSSIDLYASSIDSSTSSIFDSNTNTNTNTTAPVQKSLRFNEFVKRRDITPQGQNKESFIQINDKLHQRKHKHKHKIASSYYSYDNDPNDFIFNVM
ncbi:hypothetical protein MOSE0_F04698 [Monosporozyma servazzii]